MSGLPTGHRALGWAWLSPGLPSLLALTDDSPASGTLLRDPLALAHILRYSRPTLDSHSPILIDRVLTQPSLTETAATLLESQKSPASDTLLPKTITRVLDYAVVVAGRLAESCETVSVDAAQVATRLAALGWVATVATDAEAVERCVADASHTANPEATQRRHWGLDAATITRRLLARWRLPAWITNTVGFLNMTAEDAEILGASRELFQIVQAALLVAEELHGRCGFVHHDAATRANPRLDEAHECRATSNDADIPPSPTISKEILIRLLRATARSRRASGAVWLAESEQTIDRLVEALSQLRAEFDVRLRDAKLESLAEFAAGASHEFNNPLAVISGQAQLLLSREENADRQHQLQAIIRQAKRVHDLLHGTMQYARPSKPERSPTLVHSIIEKVDRAFRPECEFKHVRWRIEYPDPTLQIPADAEQMRQALGHLVRNAIEATPPDGEVRLCVEADDSTVRCIVEDSGSGPQPADVPHLFDPFFSGRSAGRGRGLGLPIAWRLARMNGGEVRFEPSRVGPTRFVLEIPRPVAESLPVSEERCTA